MGALSAGNLLGTISTAATALKAVDTAFSAIQTLSGATQARQRQDTLAQQNLALRQLQAQQGLNEANAAQDAALQKAQIAADAASADSTRMAALRRAVARQNADFGAQGVGSGDGSSEAVLLGLVNQSDRAKASQDALDTLKTQAIDQNLAQQKSVDVLQQAQLQQKQNLQRIIQDA